MGAGTARGSTTCPRHCPSFLFLTLRSRLWSSRRTFSTVALTSTTTGQPRGVERGIHSSKHRKVGPRSSGTFVPHALVDRMIPYCSASLSARFLASMRARTLRSLTISHGLSYSCVSYLFCCSVRQVDGRT